MGSDNIRAGRAFVEIGGDDRALTAALNRAAAKFKAMGSVVSAIGREMIKVGTAIVAPFILAGKVFSEMGANLYRASQRVGASVESLAGLAYAAKQTNVEFEALEMGLKKMEKSIVAGDAVFREIGVSLSALRGLSPEKQFALIADALSKIQDPTVRAAETLKIFGRAGTALLPLMIDGAAGIERYRKRAEALGLIMGTESAKGATELHGRIADLTDVLKNGLYRIGEAVAPVLRSFVETVTSAAISANKWITANKEVFQTALKVGAGILAAGAAFFVLGKGISFVGGVLSGLASIASVARAGFGLLGATLTALTSVPVLVAGAFAGLAAYIIYATGVGNVMLDALGGYFSDLKTDAITAFNGVTDALKANDWQLAADVAWAGLKLAWANGVAPLKELWLTLKFEGLRIFEEITDGISRATVRATEFFKQVWAKAVAFYKNLTVDLGDSMVGLWIDAQEKMGRITAKEAAAQRAQLGQLNQQAHAANDGEKAAKLAKIKEETAAQLAALEKVHDQEMLKLNKASSAEREKAEADYREKKRLLEALAGVAKGEARNPKNRNLPGLPSLPLLDNKNLPNAGDYESTLKYKAAGTFSAAGAFGLAGKGGAEQRIAKASEQTVIEQKKTNDLLRQHFNVLGGATFQ